MLGCVSLHLASKLNEETAIAIESYIDISKGIFTQEEFISLEKKVWQRLKCRIYLGTTIHEMCSFICSQVLDIEMDE